jgi:hypothetical protein
VTTKIWVRLLARAQAPGVWSGNRCRCHRREPHFSLRCPRPRRLGNTWQAVVRCREPRVAWHLNPFSAGALLPAMRGPIAAVAISLLAIFGSGHSDARSMRKQHVDDRNKAAMSSICRGCMAQSHRHSRARRDVVRTKIPRARDFGRRTAGRGTSGWVPLDPLPLTSDAEVQIRSTNRALEAQQQRTHMQQQFQFEINQLRGQLLRDRLY